MPRRMAALIIAAAFMAVTLSGCAASYSHSFKSTQSYGGWLFEETPLPESLGLPVPFPYALYAMVPGKGMELRDAAASCPKRFAGDFTLFIDFTLKADSTHVIDFKLSLSDLVHFGEGSHVHLGVYGVGGADEEYSYEEHAPGFPNMLIPAMGLPPGLNKASFNSFKLEKVGNVLNMSLNGKSVCSILLNDYESVWFAPNIWVHEHFSPDPEFGMFIEKVKVTYESGQIDDTPLP